jgi:hypothetical protein
MNKRWLKLTLFTLTGAIAGYAYYYFIGCYNGHCIISSNPYISTGYGLAAGLFLAWDSKKPEDKEKS